MKIYFAASIRGGRQDRALYEKIIMLLSAYGDVLTEHVGNKKYAIHTSKEMVEKIYEDDMDKLEKSHVVVAEVSTPSLGVGYEIARAEQSHIPILCLYRKSARKSLSAMIAGNSQIQVKTYQTVDDMAKILDDFFTKVGPIAKDVNNYCCGGGCCQ